MDEAFETYQVTSGESRHKVFRASKATAPAIHAPQIVNPALHHTPVNAGDAPAWRVMVEALRAYVGDGAVLTDEWRRAVRVRLRLRYRPGEAVMMLFEDFE